MAATAMRHSGVWALGSGVKALGSADSRRIATPPPPPSFPSSYRTRRRGFRSVQTREAAPRRPLPARGCPRRLLSPRAGPCPQRTIWCGHGGCPLGCPLGCPHATNSMHLLIRPTFAPADMSR